MRKSGAEQSAAQLAQGEPSCDVSLGYFRAFVNAKRGLVLDARPGIFHRDGHVPGAVSLPRDDFESSYARVKVLLEANRGQSMVVYCSDDACDDSKWVCQALTSLGYTRVNVFRGGWDAWTHAGLPTEK